MAEGKASNKKKISKDSFRRLLTLFFYNKGNAIVLIVCVVIAGLTAALGPKMLGNATNALTGSTKGQIVGTPDWNEFAKWAVISLIIYLVQFATKAISGRVSAKNSSDVAYYLRRDIEKKLWKLPLNYFDTNAHGDIMSRVTNDIDNVIVVVNTTGGDSIFYLLQLFITLIMMLTISWKLALITFVIIPLSSLFVKKIVAKSKPELKKQWAIMGAINANIDESFNGHTLIRSYGMEERFIEDFKKQNDALYEASYKAIKIQNMIQPLSRMVTNFNYVLVAIIGAVQVLSGQMSIGDLQAFIQYARRYQTPFSMLAQAYSSLQSGIASLDRIYELIDSTEELEEKDDAKDDYRIGGEIEFKDVSFSYVPEVKLIENMNLRVKPGQMVAIVGGTGAGKTTLVNLIERFYEINGGDIVFDGGVGIKDITRKSLRSNIAMVLQDTWVYKGTIEENLKYGIPEGREVTEEQFKKACKDTFVDSFVCNLPEGYNTVITNELSSLSAGEKQLLTICRAFLANPNILILDEATSSVDTRTEAIIQKALDKLREGRTSFVIAHRLSTIRNADVILVMDHGHIVEQGNHEELLRKNGAYASLYNSQFAS